MKKFILPLIVAIVSITMLTAPALAEPQPVAAAQPLPAGTASPRSWDKLVSSDGSLKQDAIKSDSAILMDAMTGKVLYDKDAEEQRFPASTTKLMTCLLALESGKDLDDMVTAGNLPSLPSDATNIDLKPGETMSLHDLLLGLMLESGNDAANAIAVYVAGSVPSFVDLMNSKAQELGMTHTHYKNTNGLHDDDHYTTAYDMALLMKAAMKLGTKFTDIIHTADYVPAATNMHPDKRTWHNTDKLIDDSSDNIYYYANTVGGKTGYTTPARYCFVGLAKQGSQELIAVVMHGTGINDKWPDCITMFEYGFINYKTLDLSSFLESQPLSADIKDAASTDPEQGKLALKLQAQTQEYITDHTSVISDLQSNPTQFQQQVTITKDTAPIDQGETIGSVTFSYQGKPVLTCDLLASRAVEASTPAPAATLSPTKNAVETHTPGSTANHTQTAGSTGNILVWAAIVLLLLLLLGLTIRFINMQRRNRRYSYRQGSGTRMRR